MNGFIELARLLDQAGYEIVDYYNENYNTEPCILRCNQGIKLRIVRVKSPNPPVAPAETP